MNASIQNTRHIHEIIFIIREGDTLAHFGGDELVVVLADLANVENYEPILVQRLKAAANPVTVGNAIMQVSASMAVAIYPPDNVNEDQLMCHANANADQAMSVAKQSVPASTLEAIKVFESKTSFQSKLQVQ
tara:strand:- start:110540 stop:110935 length:396 start_codon:yes stop_codon:yes gene_type:complete